MLLLLSTSAAETRFLHALPAAHAVWLNTQNCPWFGSQISLICCELSGALSYEPPPHKGCCPWTPLGNFCPQSCFSSPTPKSWLRHCAKVDTQATEGMWMQAKRKLHYQSGTSRTLFASYLAEFQWHYSHKTHSFGQYLKLLNENFHI